MNQTALIVTILVLSVSHISAQDQYREREEGEIILEKADITASKSSDDLGCLIDLKTNTCEVTTEAQESDYISWFEFSLNGQTHCVTKIEVYMETTRRTLAHYRINCDNTGCSEVTFVSGAFTSKEGSDLDVMEVEVSVLEGEEEGTTDPACPGMVGNKVKFSQGMADLNFFEVVMFGEEFEVKEADEDKDEAKDKEHEYSGTVVLGMSSLLLQLLVAGMFIF